MLKVDVLRYIGKNKEVGTGRACVLAEMLNV